MKIILLGEPRSTNNIYKSTCRGSFVKVYMSEEGRNLKESYQWQAKAQSKGVKLITTPLWVAIKLYYSDKRRRDWDNYHKLSMDALSGIIWLDDSQIEFATVKKEYDKENPRIEIEITKAS